MGTSQSRPQSLALPPLVPQSHTNQELIQRVKACLGCPFTDVDIDLFDAVLCDYEQISEEASYGQDDSGSYVKNLTKVFLKLFGFFNTKFFGDAFTQDHYSFLFVGGYDGLWDPRFKGSTTYNIDYSTPSESWIAITMYEQDYSGTVASCRGYAETLVHEMLHGYLGLFAGNDYHRSIGGHGPGWQQPASMIEKYWKDCLGWSLDLGRVDEMARDFLVNGLTETIRRDTCINSLLDFEEVESRMQELEAIEVERLRPEKEIGRLLQVKENFLEEKESLLQENERLLLQENERRLLPERFLQQKERFRQQKERLRQQKERLREGNDELQEEIYELHEENDELGEEIERLRKGKENASTRGAEGN